MVGQTSVFALLILCVTVDAAKILALFGFPSKSHVGAYIPYLEELIKRGHEVTVVSAYPRKTPLTNYTEIVLKDSLTTRDSKAFNVFDIGEAYFMPMLFFFFHVCYESCGHVLQQPKMQQLIHSEDHQFDLVIYEPFFTECTYGLLHKFKAPTIQILPNTVMPLMGNPVGNPSTTSYIPDLMMDYEISDFAGRLHNFLRIAYVHIFRKLYIIPKMDSLMRKHFPDPTLPSIEELETNTTFLFLHSHPVLNYPRPLTPNTIEVGGLHIKDTQKLPEDLQKFLDDAPYGVIYFSLGSNVRSVDMPLTMRRAIMNTFSKLKQKVLCKWEDDTLPGQPQNVRLGKWFPQHDILAHSNIKLFISHGGLMSIQEATYFGVPLIAIPVLGDQKLNAKHAEEAGYAVRLDLRSITEETLSLAIQKVLHETRYRENAKRLSNIFRDQPQKPLDRAIFWTEYAIRHKGAPHMRSASLKLNFFQYYLLDIIALFLLVGLILVVLLILFVHVIAKCLCSKAKKSNIEGKKNR